MRRTILRPLVLAGLLVAGACSSDRDTVASEPSSPAATVVDATATRPVESAAPTPSSTPAPVVSTAPIPPTTTAPTTSTAPTTVPTTAAPTTAAATTTNVETAEPAPLDDACGTFGPIPPRPDSMPTKTFDTDGDGEFDDEVTAYGAADAWRIRIVQNGVTSEAAMPEILGFAAFDEPVVTESEQRPVVRDFDTQQRYVFATDERGCVNLVEILQP